MSTTTLPSFTLDDLAGVIEARRDPADEHPPLTGDHDLLALTVHNNCHAIALAVVRSGVLGDPGPECRVARGWSRGIGSQHSWIALGDPYGDDTVIVDPTGWSWPYLAGESGSGPLVGRFGDIDTHTPHGYVRGNPDIMNYGKPRSAADNGEEPIEMATEGLSPRAKSFISVLTGWGHDPLGWKGWHDLLNTFPTRGWPAGEIIAHCYEGGAGDPFGGLLTIDRVGMVTDLNPSDLYW